MNFKNEYNISNENILKEFLNKLKYTFLNRLIYVGTTTEHESESTNNRDIDVLLIIDGLNESRLTYVWDIISSLYMKYNIIVDTRVHSLEDLASKEAFQNHKKYLLSLFLKDLYGKNPFQIETYLTSETRDSCLNEMQSQIQKIIKIIPRTAVEHASIKSIAHCVFDALRAFLILEDKPVASKRDTVDIINKYYLDFSEVSSIYQGYLNPSEIINISKFISDSLALVKHIFYRSLKRDIQNKVLLVNTPSSLYPHPRSDYLKYDLNMPLGLVCLVSYLEDQGLEADILDAYAKNMGAIEIVDKIFKEMNLPKIIAFNSSSPNIHVVHKVASYIKRVNSDIIIVCGGPHASIAKEHTLSEKSINYVVSGEGELPLTNLVKSIFSENSKYVPNIPGIHKLIAQKVVGMENKEQFDLAKMPKLNFGKLPINDYFSVKKRLYVHSTRGCAFNCIYCSVPKCWGSKVRELPIELLIKQIGDAIKEYGANEVQIVDDNFSHQKGRLINRFCEEKLKENLTFGWKCQVRADQVDNDLLVKMSDAECFEIDFGIESGNSKIQKYIRKNLNLESALKLTAKAAELKIFTKAFFMLGFPEEGYDQIEDSINYSIDLKNCGLNDIAFFPVMPFPGTEISEITGKTVFQGATIDSLNFHENTYVNKKLRKYSAKPEISLNPKFTPNDLRTLVKMSYHYFDLGIKVKNLEREFLDFKVLEEESVYSF